MKLYVKSIIAIGVISTVVLGGFFTWQKLTAPNEAQANMNEPPIDDLIKQTIVIDPITTNLKDGGIIKAKFELVSSTAKNAEELKKISFKINSIIIQYMNGLKKEDLTGAAGIEALENNLLKKLNDELGGSYIKHVYTTEKLIQ
ncbi:MAG TPA: flagellar basal body-associated FliL family protein [Bacillota bacterium]|nr:flagellar basal body-associated FliL family protein [Bacillota bacterium]